MQYCVHCVRNFSHYITLAKQTMAIFQVVIEHLSIVLPAEKFRKAKADASKGKCILPSGN